MKKQRKWYLALGIGATAVLAASCSSSSSSSTTTAPASGSLVGVFHLTAGSNSGSAVTGSYFRMISPGGTISAGPFFSNPDSTATDKSYTFVSPGNDGGLKTGAYQPDPTPPFDAKGNALADTITAPQAFVALNFSISTNSTDPQSKDAVPKPEITDKDGQLSGQVEAISAAWNNQYFNQGSPKPGGGSPGLTTPVSGTYNPTTHAFVLTWASQVVGGPFNGFTGYWHLQGSFTPGG
jgi:hypothetical protein